jgi:hypothetical protein
MSSATASQYLDSFGWRISWLDLNEAFRVYERTAIGSQIFNDYALKIVHTIDL